MVSCLNLGLSCVAQMMLLHDDTRQLEGTISLIEQLLPKSIHAVSAPGFELKVLSFVIATSIKNSLDKSSNLGYYRSIFGYRNKFRCAFVISLKVEPELFARG